MPETLTRPVEATPMNDAVPYEPPGPDGYPIPDLPAFPNAGVDGPDRSPATPDAPPASMREALGLDPDTAAEVDTDPRLAEAVQTEQQEDIANRYTDVEKFGKSFVVGSLIQSAEIGSGRRWGHAKAKMHDAITSPRRAVQQFLFKRAKKAHENLDERLTDASTQRERDVVERARQKMARREGKLNMTDIRSEARKRNVDQTAEHRAESYRETAIIRQERAAAKVAMRAQVRDNSPMEKRSVIRKEARAALAKMSDEDWRRVGGAAIINGAHDRMRRTHRRGGGDIDEALVLDDIQRQLKKNLSGVAQEVLDRDKPAPVMLSPKYHLSRSEYMGPSTAYNVPEYRPQPVQRPIAEKAANPIEAGAELEDAIELFDKVKRQAKHRTQMRVQRSSEEGGDGFKNNRYIDVGDGSRRDRSDAVFDQSILHELGKDPNTRNHPTEAISFTEVIDADDTPVMTRNEATGADEPIVKFRYNFQYGRDTNNDIMTKRKEAESRGLSEEEMLAEGILPIYGDRNDGTLNLSMDIPKSMADELQRRIQEDPSFARDIVADMALNNSSLTSEQWLKVRPPYDKLPKDWQMTVIRGKEVYAGGIDDDYETERLALAS